MAIYLEMIEYKMKTGLVEGKAYLLDKNIIDDSRKGRHTRTEVDRESLIVRMKLVKKYKHYAMFERRGIKECFKYFDLYQMLGDKMPQ